MQPPLPTTYLQPLPSYQALTKAIPEVHSVIIKVQRYSNSMISGPNLSSCDQRMNRLHLQFYHGILWNSKRGQHLIIPHCPPRPQDQPELVQTPRETTAHNRNQARTEGVSEVSRGASPATGQHSIPSEGQEGPTSHCGVRFCKHGHPSNSEANPVIFSPHRGRNYRREIISNLSRSTQVGKWQSWAPNPARGFKSVLLPLPPAT